MNKTPAVTEDELRAMRTAIEKQGKEVSHVHVGGYIKKHGFGPGYIVVRLVGVQLRSDYPFMKALKEVQRAVHSVRADMLCAVIYGEQRKKAS